MRARQLNPRSFIIGLVGPKGSGKGTVAAYLRRRYGATVFTFADVLDDILKVLNIPQLRVNQIALSLALRKRFGSDVLARVLFDRSVKAKTRLIVIDGIRFQADYRPWRSRRYRFVLVSINADKRRRFERLRNRHKRPEEQRLTLQKFLREERLPTEVNFASLQRRADYSINANTTIADLKRQVDAVAAALKIKIKKIV